MGNCFFFKTSQKDIKIPRLINTINEEVSKKSKQSLVNPFEPIDVIIDDTLPKNLLKHLRKNESEFSLEQPERTSLSKHSTHVYFIKTSVVFNSNN